MCPRRMLNEIYTLERRFAECIFAAAETPSGFPFGAEHLPSFQAGYQETANSLC